MNVTVEGQVYLYHIDLRRHNEAKAVKIQDTIKLVKIHRCPRPDVVTRTQIHSNTRRLHPCVDHVTWTDWPAVEAWTATAESRGQWVKGCFRCRGSHDQKKNYTSFEYREPFSVQLCWEGPLLRSPGTGPIRSGPGQSGAAGRSAPWRVFFYPSTECMSTECPVTPLL